MAPSGFADTEPLSLTHASPTPQGSPRRPVREAEARDVGPLAEILARAFQHDPIHRWLLPGEAEWARGSTRFWAELIRRVLRHGVVLTTLEPEGAALWEPPNAVRDGLVKEILFSARMLWILRRRALRGLRFGNLLEAHRPRQPHWYLAVLGTAPESQGKGVSTAVMQPVLQRCDAQGLLAYLESSNPANIPLYERRGFAVIGELHVPGGPSAWPMLRKPQGRKLF